MKNAKIWMPHEGGRAAGAPYLEAFTVLLDWIYEPISYYSLGVF